MKTKFFVYICILFFTGLQGCSDSDNSNNSPACFSISSKNIYDGSFINGGQYSLTDIQNNIIGTYTLANGTLNITNLPIGEYIVKEISPPEGYVTEQKEIKFQLLNSNCTEIAFLYISQQKGELPKSQKLKFYNAQGDILLGDYNAVLIGEYYWIDQNFYHVIDAGNGFENNVSITQELLNKYVGYVNIDPKYYQLADINDFEKYYGRYYSYPSIDYMNKYCYISNEYSNKIDGWKLPSPEDYRQLFAMCPFNTSHDGPHTTLNERDVRFALGTKEGDNPLAFNIDQGDGGPYKVYWFNHPENTNIYGFNMMPGGARLNGDGIWCNGIGPNGGCHDGKWGDVYHLFYAAYFAVQNPNGLFGAAIIHDYVDTKEFETYHYLNVRWCRPLSDLELGYKLYINTEQTDIKKLDLDSQVPTGYSELAHGYLRGFYVQYILNNPNPSVTIQDLVQYSRTVEDPINF